MKTIIEIIPHDQQRYETCGDWFFDYEDDGTTIKSLNIKVSSMNNWKYEYLVVYHELHEALACLAANVSEEDVTLFDRLYEDARAKGFHDETSEPGDEPNAPYHEQHVSATKAEKELAKILNVDWSDYEKTIYAL